MEPTNFLGKTYIEHIEQSCRDAYYNQVADALKHIEQDAVRRIQEVIVQMKAKARADANSLTLKILHDANIHGFNVRFEI